MLVRVRVASIIYEQDGDYEKAGGRSRATASACSAINHCRDVLDGQGKQLVHLQAYPKSPLDHRGELDGLDRGLGLGLGHRGELDGLDRGDPKALECVVLPS